MRVVIVGGGKIGAQLALQLRKSRTPVVVIEKRRERAREVAETTDALVIEGDGTDLGLMERLDLRPADFLIAATGVDQDNLVACQLARTAFGVSRVFARLNDPKNHTTFVALQIPIVSVTEMLVAAIGREIDVTELIRASLLDRGGVETIEVVIPEGAAPRAVRDIGLPQSTLVIVVTRDDRVFVPDGSTMIQAEDQLLVVTQSAIKDTAREILIASGGEASPEAEEQ